MWQAVSEEHIASIFRFGKIIWFHAQFIFSTLKMKAICSSETSVDTQRTTRRYIPEVDTLHNVSPVFLGPQVNAAIELL
jgi:hypothetical protein